MKILFFGTILFIIPGTSRTSMESQTKSMGDVLDKSNNALLQIEASRSIKPSSNDPNCLPYTCNKETINDLTKIVEKFTNLLSVSVTMSQPDTNTTFEDYLETASQRSEYLGSNVRKLMAVWDTVQQMRMLLLRQEMEMDREEDEDDDKENYNL